MSEFNERYLRNSMTERDYEEAKISMRLGTAEPIDSPKRSAAETLVQDIANLVALSERVVELVSVKTSAYRLDTPRHEGAEKENIRKSLPAFFEHMDGAIRSIARNLRNIESAMHEAEL